MKTFIIGVILLCSAQYIVKSKNNNLDTVYVQDKAAWKFYAHFTMIINYTRKYNLSVLFDNDPKAKDALYIIDKLIDDNVNPECVTKPLLQLGVHPSLIPRYKLHFLQQLTGDYYPPGVKMGIDSQVPDHIMFIVDAKTKMLVYMKSTAFEYSDNHEMNIQIIGSDVLQIANISMNGFRLFGYHYQK